MAKVVVVTSGKGGVGKTTTSAAFAAGLGGNSGARIFCSKLQAELLAIDGVYQTADDMPATVLGKPVQVWLDGDQMKITVLD